MWWCSMWDVFQCFFIDSRLFLWVCNATGLNGYRVGKWLVCFSFLVYYGRPELWTHIWDIIISKFRVATYMFLFLRSVHFPWFNPYNSYLSHSLLAARWRASRYWLSSCWKDAPSTPCIYEVLMNFTYTEMEKNKWTASSAAEREMKRLR